MAQKRKTLPKDFNKLVESAEMDRLKSVFDTCLIDARGGYSKQTALAFGACPDRLTEWLIAQGADIEAIDRDGETPLHSRARSWNGNVAILLTYGAAMDTKDRRGNTPLHAAARSYKSGNIDLLVQAGSGIDVVNDHGLTPLMLAMQGCQNTGIVEMVKIAKILLVAGAPQTPDLQQHVTRIGESFEFHRDNFNAETVAEFSAALDELYVIFDVTPVGGRIMHDNLSKLTVTTTGWQEQHQELWDMLVPSAGPAMTLQGEVVRIAGRIADEINRNGGVNWNIDYNRMADAFAAHVRTGTSLAVGDLQKVDDLITSAKRKVGTPEYLAQMAVQWVLLNPMPVVLAKPNYAR